MKAITTIYYNTLGVIPFEINVKKGSKFLLAGVLSKGIMFIWHTAKNHNVIWHIVKRHNVIWHTDKKA